MSLYAAHKLSPRWLRWLAIPAAAAVLALAYHLTRPPELIWWRSPEFGNTGHKARLLIPGAWDSGQYTNWRPHTTHLITEYAFSPPTIRPAFLRRLFRIQSDVDILAVAAIFHERSSGAGTS